MCAFIWEGKQRGDEPKMRTILAAIIGFIRAPGTLSRSSTPYDLLGGPVVIVVRASERCGDYLDEKLF